MFIQNSFSILGYVMLAIIASYMLAAFFASVFQCTPVARAWDQTILEPALPMYPIYNFMMTLNWKIALMGVFALGAFVAVTSIIWMQTLDALYTGPDIIYDLASSVWTIIEGNMAIICACFLMMRAPLTRLFTCLFPSSHQGTNTGDSELTGFQLRADHDVASSISLDPISDSPARTSEVRTGNILPHSWGEEVMYHDGKGIMKVTEYQVSPP